MHNYPCQLFADKLTVPASSSKRTNGAFCVVIAVFLGLCITRDNHFLQGGFYHAS